MAEVLLSCEMLEDEMQLALQRTGVQMPIVWLDAGLHEYPAKLRASLRERLQSWSKAMTRFCWAFACAAMPWTVSAPASAAGRPPGSMTASGC